MTLEIACNLIKSQIALWKGVTAINSSYQNTYTFFLHADIGRKITFKGMLDIVALESESTTVIIQLYLNLAGDNVNFEELSKKIRETNLDSSLKIDDKDRIMFKYIKVQPHLVLIGIMGQTDNNYRSRFNELTCGLSSAIEKFCPVLLSE